MKANLRATHIVVLFSPMLLAAALHANTTITTFDLFTADALYGAWTAPGATVVSGATSYNITATGSGSAYKFLGGIAAGNATTLELTLTLTGPAAAAGNLSPIVSLVDGDGTQVAYVWPGLAPGSHVLTLPLNAPTWVFSAGSVPGLDLSDLRHLQVQIDAGESIESYTVNWENLKLMGAPTVITQWNFVPATRRGTLTWSAQAGQTYIVLYAATPNGAFTPLATNAVVAGPTSTATVTLPAGNSGYLRIRQESAP